MEPENAGESSKEETLVAKMIPPFDVEFPKIVGDTIYSIAGGTIVEEKITLPSVEEIRHMLGVSEG